MAFEPRLKDEILQDLMSSVIQRSNLSDTNQGSAVLSILGAFADELEGIEYRLKRIRDSFTLRGATGSDLDERVSDLPGGSVTRLEASAASGACLKIKRKVDPNTGVAPVTPLVVPAGSTYSRTDVPGIMYVQSADVTIAANQLEYPVGNQPYINVVANVFGSPGNCDSGSINVVKTAPDDIESVTQLIALSSGLDRETDDSLKYRAIAFISGLARCNKKAIEAMVRGYTSADGIQVRDVGIYEDINFPGLTYVTVDDGTGFQGFIKDGKEVAGTVPTGSSAPVTLFHEMPATAPIGSNNFLIKKVGEPVYSFAPLNPDGSPRWISIPERGILYPDATLLSPGDDWIIAGYTVYTGPIAEIQAKIEGDPGDFTASPGYRAAGTRVIVKAAHATYLATMTVNIGLEVGFSFTEVAQALKEEIVEWFKTLSPGETFYKPVLYQHLLNQFDAQLVTLEITDPEANSFSVQPDHSLRIQEEDIKIT